VASIGNQFLDALVDRFGGSVASADIPRLLLALILGACVGAERHGANGLRVFEPTHWLVSVLRHLWI
jgi:hypothetical protein